MATAVAPAPAPSSRQEDAFAKMQISISKYAKSNDRRMVLRSLRDVKYLKCVPLDPFAGPNDSMKAYEEELIGEENIVLNGVPFHGSHHLLTTLKELCAKLCESDIVKMSSAELYENLVSRIARSTSSADAFFKLNSLIGSSDLMMMPTTQKQTFPIKIDLYVSSGQIHSNLSVINTFGLFRKSDVKPSDLTGTAVSSRPWISLHATITERANITTGNAVRQVQVRLPENLY